MKFTFVLLLLCLANSYAYRLAFSDHNEAGDLIAMLTISEAALPSTRGEMTLDGNERAALCMFPPFCVGDGVGNYYLVADTPWYACEYDESNKPLGDLHVGGAVNGVRSNDGFHTNQNCTGSTWWIPGGYFANSSVSVVFEEYTSFCDPTHKGITISVPRVPVDHCSSRYTNYPYESSFVGGTYGYLNGCDQQDVTFSLSTTVSKGDLLCVDGGENSSFPFTCISGNGQSQCSASDIPACDGVYYGSELLKFSACVLESSESVEVTPPPTQETTSDAVSILVHVQVLLGVFLVGWLMILF